MVSGSIWERTLPLFTAFDKQVPGLLNLNKLRDERPLNCHLGEAKHSYFALQTCCRKTQFANINRKFTSPNSTFWYSLRHSCACHLSKHSTLHPNIQSRHFQYRKKTGFIQWKATYRNIFYPKIWCYPIKYSLVLLRPIPLPYA